MLFVKVTYKGRRFNYYFQGDKKKLVELDERGNEKQGSDLTDFAESELTAVPVFEADYVHELRNSEANARTTVNAVLQKLNIKDAKDIDTYLADVEAKIKAAGGDGKNDSETVKQLRTMMEDQRRGWDAEKAGLVDAQGKIKQRWKDAVRDSALMAAVAVPNAARPEEVKLILERYVDVDDDGNISVYEDVAHSRKRLAPNGQPMTVKELSASYYKENPHHIVGHPGGGGSGGQGGGKPQIDQNLPPEERLKQLRRSGAQQ